MALVIGDPVNVLVTGAISVIVILAFFNALLEHFSLDQHLEFQNMHYMSLLTAAVPDTSPEWRLPNSLHPWQVNKSNCALLEQLESEKMESDMGRPLKQSEAEHFCPAKVIEVGQEKHLGQVDRSKLSQSLQLLQSLSASDTALFTQRFLEDLPFRDGNLRTLNYVVSTLLVRHIGFFMAIPSELMTTPFYEDFLSVVSAFTTIPMAPKERAAKQQEVPSDRVGAIENENGGYLLPGFHFSQSVFSTVGDLATCLIDIAVEQMQYVPGSEDFQQILAWLRSVAPAPPEGDTEIVPGSEVFEQILAWLSSAAPAPPEADQMASSEAEEILASSSSEAPAPPEGSAEDAGQITSEAPAPRDQMASSEDAEQKSSKAAAHFEGGDPDHQMALVSSSEAPVPVFEASTQSSSDSQVQTPNTADVQDTVDDAL